MNYLFDNMISPKIARALKILAEAYNHYEIIHLTEKFDRSAKDIEWIGELAVEGDWVIISGDVRITRGRAERLAWQESGLTCFFFGDGWGNQRFWRQAADLVHWWPLIEEKSRAANRGESFFIPLRGKEFKPIR